MSSTDGETSVLTLEQEIDKTNPCLAYLTGQGTTSNIFSLRLIQSDSQCWACAVGAYRGSVTGTRIEENRVSIMPLQRNLEMAQPIDEVILFRCLIFFFPVVFGCWG